MNFELFNEKSKILINDAQNKAVSLNHQQVSPNHLVYSILSENDNFILNIFEEIGLDYLTLKKQVENLLQDKPKVMGENLNIFFSDDLIKVFEKSQKIKNEFNDDFISPEILLYTILCCEEIEIYGLLKKIELNKNKLKDIILKLRGGETINSNSKSIDSKSLKKFSINLTELAKKGQLDPCYWKRRRNQKEYSSTVEKNKK